MNRFLYLWTLLLMQTLVFAQAEKPHCHFSIVGKIYDTNTGEPLQGASIYNTEHRLQTTSDESGNFYLDHLCEGKHTLVFFNVGNTSKDTVVFVKAKKTRVEISLAMDSAQQLEVQITSVRKDSIVPKGAVSVLDGTSLDAAKMLSLGEGLKSLPGVYAQQSGANTYKPVVQGLSGNRVLLFNNGVRQEGQQWGTDHAPEIDPTIANEIEVIKGASTVQYGSDAIGGVILVKPAPLLEHGLKSEWYFSGNSVNKSGAIAGKIDWAPHRIKGFSGRIQGSVKRGGNYRTPRYYLDNTGLSEYNFSWAAGYKTKRFYSEFYYSQFNTETGIFTGSHVGNVSDLEQAIHSDTPVTPNVFSYTIGKPYQHIEHELAKGEIGINLNKKQKVSLELARQFNYRSEYDNHKAYNSLDNTGPQLEFRITTYTATLNWKHRWRRNLNGNFGVNGMHQENTVAGRIFIPNFINTTIGAFWIEQWSIAKWSLEAGIRYDVRNLNAYYYENNILEQPSYQYQNYAASLGAALALTENSAWSILFSRAFRSPAVNELFSKGLHHGAAAIENGNINLVPEKAYNLSTGYKYAKLKWKGELNLYANYIEDYIYLNPSGAPELTIQGAFPVFTYEQTNALLYGGDINLAYQLTNKINLECKASTLSARDLNKQSYVIYMPPTRIEPAVYYQLKNTERLKDITFSISSTVVFKKENAPQNVDYLPPPNGYALFNAQATALFKVGREWLTAGIKVSNILNKTYRDYLDRFRYYHDAPGTAVQVFLKIPLTIKK
jgi:iron complex outermembrane recepter protein